jgi:hypothetical protein
MQGGGGHAPRLTRGHVTTGQRQWKQVTDALEVVRIHVQNLTAPGRAVAAQPNTVECHADHGTMDAMLSQDGSDVCVMVLHADGRYTALMGQP